MNRCILRKEVQLTYSVSKADANLQNVTVCTLQNEYIINPKNFILTKLILYPKFVYSFWLISQFFYRAMELYLIENRRKVSLNIPISHIFCNVIYLYINILNDVLKIISCTIKISKSDDRF